MSHHLRSHGLSLFALLCLVVVLYGPTVDFHFVNWDDRHHVYANPAVVAPETAPAVDRWLGKNIGYPLPLTLATWRLDRARFGPQSRAKMRPEMGKGYHQTQLIFIGFLALSLYLLGCVSVAPGWPAGVLAGLVLSHPLAVEPLVWITGRKDLLVAVFAVGTLASLWKARGVDTSEARRWWGLAGLLALLAMASKPTGISLAAFCLWVAVLGQQRAGRTPRISWIITATLAGVAGVIVVVGSAWHQDVGGIQGDGGNPLLRSLHATSWHLQMLAAPAWLRAKYVLLPPEQLPTWELWIRVGGAALVGVALAVSALRWRRSPVGWAAAFGLAAWLPVSNLVPLRRHVADSYMLLPLIAVMWAGLAAAYAWGAQQGPRQTRWIALAGVGLIVVLSLKTAPQVQTWRTSVQLWEHTLEYEKNSPQVCRMAGHGLFFEGNKQGSLTLWEACIGRFGPELFANNVAVVALQLGQKAKARRWFSWVLKRHPNDERAARYLRRLGPPSP